MHKLISIIFLFSVGGVFSQSIENVDFRSEGKTIVVTYDFFHSKTDTAINVELVFKDQQGGVVIPKTITGAIKNVKPGESKRIVWDVLIDGITLSGKYKAEISIQKKLPSINIGNHVWDTENINEEYFRNGDLIPEAKTAEEWVAAGNAKRPAWCYYDNDPKNGALYGKLYNWYAVNDMRGLAPYGWHVPSDEEWTAYSIDFNGLPGGYCRNGIFNFVGYSGSWWSTSETDVSSAWSRDLVSSNSSLNRYNDSKNNGFSVRCVSDDPNTDQPRFIGSNKPSNPFGTGGTVGSTGTGKSPFDGNGSASGYGGSVGNAGTGDGRSRTRLNDPILNIYKTDIDIIIHLKLIINEDGKVISATNIASKTTTTDQEIINSVISEVIKQVKYNKEKNAGLQFTYVACTIRAHN